MTPGPPIDLRRIEEQSLNVTQTARQLFYDGWLLRLMPGRIKRARSVNAFHGSTLDVQGKIRHCESVYAAAGLPAIFRITPFDQPPALDAALEAAGYAAFEITDVMVTSLSAPPPIAVRDDIEIHAPDLHGYCAAVATLRGATHAQRKAHEARLAHAAVNHHCAVVLDHGRALASGQLAYEGATGGVFDVVTAADVRGRGHATALCAHLLTWAWSH
ncbi:MAG: GNAT family N-acetyltransferase [Casimicrobiaceae bacterium]